MRFVKALLFVFGLLLAGSDGAYFPWLNGVGIMLFIILIRLTLKDIGRKTYYG